MVERRDGGRREEGDDSGTCYKGGGNEGGMK